MGPICAFTGPAPQELPFHYSETDLHYCALKQCLRRQMINLIEKYETTHFITGMWSGVELLAAEVVLDLKANYPNITLECAFPFETQAAKWKEVWREHYFDIAARCDKETMLQRQYSPNCIYKQRRYIVDHADIVLAVWDGQPSNSGMTVCYAREKHIPVLVINPNTLNVLLQE